MREEPENDDELWMEEDITSVLIFTGKEAPSEAQALRILLDARTRSSLNWAAAKHEAQQQSAQGLRILWDLELGLFSDLEFPLSTQHQFQTLALAIKHFLETVWQAFPEQTLGVNLYNGPALEISAGSDYLDMLAAHIPEALPRFYTFDLSSVPSLAQQACLLDLERFPHTHLIVKNAGIPLDGWAYEGAWIKPTGSQEARIGVCLPSELSPTPFSTSLEAILKQLQAAQTPYRIIPENLLTTRWDGLDEIIVLPDTLSSEGQRKLKGFTAAGGLVRPAVIND